MSQADELLNSVSTSQKSARTVDPDTEEHIVIGADRVITVPDELKRIAVQYDHNIETVTFDCPRYWDGHDMSEMKIYINYARADRVIGMYIADNVRVDDVDETIMHFDWTISKNATLAKGRLTFLVCVVKTDDDGFEEKHWNSELNEDMVISEGLECEEGILDLHPDILTQMLTQMDYIQTMQGETQVMLKDVLKISTPEAMQEYVITYFTENPLDALVAFDKLYPLATDLDVDTIIDNTYSEDQDETNLHLATNLDIDEMIDGTYIGESEDVDDSNITDDEIDDIVDGLF